MRIRDLLATATLAGACALPGAALAQARADIGKREMPVWGPDYTVQATELFPDLPVNQAQFVRTRIMALLEHLTRIQEP